MVDWIWKQEIESRWFLTGMVDKIGIRRRNEYSEHMF